MLLALLIAVPAVISVVDAEEELIVLKQELPKGKEYLRLPEAHLNTCRESCHRHNPGDVETCVQDCLERLDADDHRARAERRELLKINRGAVAGGIVAVNLPKSK